MGSRRFWHLPVVSVVAVGLLLGTTEPAQAGPRPVASASMPVSIYGYLETQNGNRTLPAEGGVVKATFDLKGLEGNKDYQLKLEVFDYQNGDKPKEIQVTTMTPFHTGAGQNMKTVKSGFRVPDGHAGKQLVVFASVSRGGANLGEVKEQFNERMTVRVASGDNQARTVRSSSSVQQPEESLTMQPRSTQPKTNSFFEIFDIFGLSS